MRRSSCSDQQTKIHAHAHALTYHTTLSKMTVQLVPKLIKNRKKKTIIFCIINITNTTKYTAIKLKLTYRYPFVIQPLPTEDILSPHPE